MKDVQIHIVQHIINNKRIYEIKLFSYQMAIQTLSWFHENFTIHSPFDCQWNEFRWDIHKFSKPTNFWIGKSFERRVRQRKIDLTCQVEVFCFFLLLWWKLTNYYDMDSLLISTKKKRSPFESTPYNYITTTNACAISKYGWFTDSANIK